MSWQLIYYLIIYIQTYFKRFYYGINVINFCLMKLIHTFQELKTIASTLYPTQYLVQIIIKNKIPCYGHR